MLAGYKVAVVTIGPAICPGHTWPSKRTIGASLSEPHTRVEPFASVLPSTGERANARTLTWYEVTCMSV